MYIELVLFRNELKNKHVHTYKLVGIISQMIFSKVIFPKNSDINKFLKNIFNISFKDYIMKSRSIIVAQLAKLLCSSDDNSSYIKNLSSFISDKIEELKEAENLKSKKTSLDGWIK